MKSGIIDTKILLYAANQDCPEHTPALAFINSARETSGQWLLTEGICYEFLRVSTHQRVFPSPLRAMEAMDFLEKLLNTEGFDLLQAGPRHWNCLRAVVAGAHYPAGNLFFDIRTAALMRERGVRVIYTADTDFLQFSDIEVINPVKRLIPPLR